MASPRSESDRLAALGHLAYEIDTMIEARVRFTEHDRSPDGEGLSRNVYLESVLLHARNLIVFLANSHPSDTEMKPDDFSPGWDYSKFSNLSKELGALSEHLAHLSWKRISPRAGTLSPDVLDRILAGCEAFYTHLVEGSAGGTTLIRAALDKASLSSVPNREGRPWSQNSQLSTTVTEITFAGFTDSARSDTSARPLMASR